MNNMRNIIIVAVVVVVGVLVAGYFGVKSCDCDCKGDGDKVTKKVKKSKKGDNAQLAKQVAALKQQVSDLQLTVDVVADPCLKKKVCKKRKTPRRRARIRRKKKTRRPNFLPLPDNYGDSQASRNCRVVRVSGRTVYTKGCQGWQPLQYGAKKGDNRCSGLYYRKLQGNGTFTLSQQRLDENCRNFQLRKGNKWLVITPRSQRRGANVCVSNPSGEGLGYRPCNG